MKLRITSIKEVRNFGVTDMLVSDRQVKFNEYKGGKYHGS